MSEIIGTTNTNKNDDTNALSRRKIIHVDCDCFFAAVEMRDRPELAGKPLAVGGQPEGRGVIATANYEARKIGIKSAMPSAKALSLCPQLVLLPPDFERYRQVSQQIRQIFARYADLIEPASLDEAYLDVTQSKHCKGSATWIAAAIRACIQQEVRITASAGVAPNKFLAKVASDWRKPDGLTVIIPAHVATFIKTLSVEKIPGVGPATTSKLQAMGIKTAKDLQQCTVERLVNRFGRFGRRLSELSHGLDNRLIRPTRPHKSISIEHTFAVDLPDWGACKQQLPMLWSKFAERLYRHKINVTANRSLAKCFVKVRFSDFTTTTLERTDQPLTLASYESLVKLAWQRGKKPVRLLGLGMRLNSAKKQPPEALDELSQQPSLFE